MKDDNCGIDAASPTRVSGCNIGERGRKPARPHLLSLPFPFAGTSRMESVGNYGQLSAASAGSRLRVGPRWKFPVDITNQGQRRKGIQFMDINQINERVSDISASVGDYEVAHGLEDKLRRDFIEYVSSSLHASTELREMAKAVLTTEKLDFPRYCA